MKQFILIYITGFALIFSDLSSKPIEIFENERMTEIMEELPHYGKLMQREKDGFIYLKISEEYLDKLFPILEEIVGEKLVKGSSLVGAHVSVIRPAIGEPALWNIPELGSIIEFEPISLATVEPDFDVKWERVWLLTIRSKGLENLRTSYGLTPLMFGNHEFHISIGTKKR